MKLVTEGAASPQGDFVKHIDSCLGCVACMTVCPSGVDYETLIEQARATVERSYQRPLGERIFRWGILNTFPRIGLLRMLRPFVPLAKLFDRRKIVPTLGPRETVAYETKAKSPHRARVGLMLGCVQREWSSEINAATVRVLASEGCDVLAPETQGCCGALLTHAGQPERGAEMARELVARLDAAGVDAIITNAGGCGSHLRHFSPKCQDVSEFLVKLGPREARHPVAKKVAYQDSCHLQHAQKVRTQPRELLSAIPDLELMDLPESSLCCGSAGIYNLVNPQPADQLGDRKAAHIAETKPDLVVSGNVGCILQMRAALARRGDSTQVLHTIQLLDASLHR
jgi:glycolate oxidase iron-sulfur subunit